MRKILVVMLLAGMINTVQAQEQGLWKAQLHRADGNHIVFNFELRYEGGKTVWYILNASERMRVDNISSAGDSLLVQMPVFESQFRVKLLSDKKIAGWWIRSTSKGHMQMPFTAELGNGTRFEVKQPALYNISGRWATFFGQNGKAPTDTTVGEFVQKGDELSGSILTSTGDYRYLGGVVTTDGPFSPYALVGVGMNILSNSEPKITVQGQSVQATKPESETKFGLNFGAGAEYAVSKNVCLGLEFRYVMIFTETKNTAHMPISFTFTYHP